MEFKEKEPGICNPGGAAELVPGPGPADLVCELVAAGAGVCGNKGPEEFQVLRSHDAADLLPLCALAFLLLGHAILLTYILRNIPG